MLHNNRARVDVRVLRQFPEFLEFLAAPKRLIEDPKNSEEHITAIDGLDSQEALESSYQSLHQTLAADLLDRMVRCSPRFFENWVVDLLVAMGYSGSRKDAAEVIGRTGDEGIDGIIKTDWVSMPFMCRQ